MKNIKLNSPIYILLIICAVLGVVSREDILILSMAILSILGITTLLYITRGVTDLEIEETSKVDVKSNCGCGFCSGWF